MNEAGVLVSIIVPVYNAENYLNKCIDSILNQTYNNWELLLIDDGSKDNSLEICNNYKDKDYRIRVVHKENSGVSDTRNAGISISKGEKICFVDADDWLKPKFLEHLLEYSCYDYTIAGYENWPEKSKCFMTELAFKQDEMPVFFEQYLQSRPTSCATLFSSQIIKQHDIKFTPSLRSREDHLFNVQYLRWCNSASVVNSQDYVVRSRKVPIAIKFRMHSQDIINVIDSLQDGYDDIEAVFGYKAKDLKPTYGIMKQYYIEDFCKYKNDDDYFSIYSRYFHTSQKEDMYADKGFNSMNLLLDGVVAYRQVKEKAKMNELIALFSLMFNSITLRKAAFKSEMYRNLAESIIEGRKEKTVKLIELECIKNGICDFIRKFLRPVIYTMR